MIFDTFKLFNLIELNQTQEKVRKNSWEFLCEYITLLVS
jgi:hypothetical protein